MHEAWRESVELKYPLLMTCVYSVQFPRNTDHKRSSPSHHVPAYPIATSFPPIFSVPRPKSIQIFSSITTSRSSAVPLSEYATFVQDAHRRRDAGLLAMGLVDDDFKELTNNLWEIVDGYDGITKSEEGGNGMELGEDEE